MSTWKTKIVLVISLAQVFCLSLVGQPPNQTTTYPSEQRFVTGNQQRQSATINRRYQEMLGQNLARRDSQFNPSVQPRPSKKNTVSYERQAIPARLVPPGRSSSNNTPRAAAPLTHLGTRNSRPQARLSTPRVPGAEPARMPTVQAPIPNDSTHQKNRSQWKSTALHSPPAMRISSVPPAQSVANPRGQYTQPRRMGRQVPGAVDGHALPSGSKPETSRIPNRTTDHSKVTRARFVIVQDAGDPFGQETLNGTQDSDPIQEDPFADPEVNDSQRQKNQTGDPFADPPANAPQQDDPFDDPTTGNNNNQNTQDPFQNQPNNVQQVDPFPNNPNDISPGDIDVQDTRPDVDPNSNKSTNGQDDETKPTVNEEPILGPFKPRDGFRPSPILPAPARREFQGAIQPAVIVDNEVYTDQPSYFGPRFDKSALYEGVVPSPVASAQYCEHCEAEIVESTPPAQKFARRRFLRGGLCGNENCDIPDCTGCTPNPRLRSRLFASEFETEMSPGCGSDCFACNGNGFAPMFYLSVFGGYTQLENVGPFGVSDAVIPDAANATVMLNDGFGIGVALGQYQGPNLRTELEFTFRNNDVDSVFETGFTASTFDVDGTINSFSGMFNMVWDFQSRPVFGRLRPYAGAGLGYAFVDVSVPENSVIEDNENQSSFAYQLMAGLSRPVNCHMQGFVEYRYFNADPIRILASSSVGSAEYATDNVFFGVRMQF